MRVNLCHACAHQDSCACRVCRAALNIWISLTRPMGKAKLKLCVWVRAIMQLSLHYAACNLNAAPIIACHLTSWHLCQPSRKCKAAASMTGPHLQTASRLHNAGLNTSNSPSLSLQAFQQRCLNVHISHQFCSAMRLTQSWTWSRLGLCPVNLAE